MWDIIAGGGKMKHTRSITGIKADGKIGVSYTRHPNINAWYVVRGAHPHFRTQKEIINYIKSLPDIVEIRYDVVEKEWEK